MATNNSINTINLSQLTTAKLLGNSTGSTGPVQEIILGTNLSFAGSTLNATGGSTTSFSDVFLLMGA